MKNNRITKMLALLLAAVTSAGLFACGESGGGETAPAQQTDAAETEAAETTEQYPLKVPETDYDGYELSIVTLDLYNEHFKLDMEEDGDALNDAGHARNLAVSERLNAAIRVTEIADPVAAFRSTIMAGDGSYDLIFPHATTGVAAMVTDGLLVDLNDFPALDFTNPWWNQRMTESLSILGKLFYASGDIVMTWQGMNTIIFNKSYLSGLDLKKDLYQTCFDGEWTIDYLTSIIKGVAQDIDGDGQWTTADQYGALENRGVAHSYMYSAGIRVTTPDENGYPQLSMNNERMISLVGKYYDYINSGEVFLDQYSSTTYATGTYRDMLIEGRSFITNLDVGGLYPYLREIEFDFGLLPIPKLNEAQDDYAVFCGAGLIGASVLTDPERTGNILETMAYYSYQTIRPAFFDIVLENKAVRDENSYRVIRLMHEHKVFDFGFNFDKTGSAYGLLSAVVLEKKSTDFASVYASREASIIAGFDSIIEACR